MQQRTSTFRLIIYLPASNHFLLYYDGVAMYWLAAYTYIRGSVSVRGMFICQLAWAGFDVAYPYQGAMRRPVIRDKHARDKLPRLFCFHTLNRLILPIGERSAAVDVCVLIHLYLLINYFKRMKKNFLLLFLMALLPLAGWAENYDVEVTLGTINKEYGKADPTLTVDNFSIKLSSGGNFTKQELLDASTYTRLTAGENVGGIYEWTLNVSGYTNKVTKSGDTYNVVITNNGKVNILAKDISGATVTATVANQTYNVGNWNAPSFTLTNTDNGEVLGDDDIASFEYKNAADGAITGVGTGNKIIVKGKGNYTGTKEINFDIAAKALDADGIVAALANPTATFTYNKEEQKPEVVVTDGETELTASSDYTVGYPADATNAGDKEITITGTGNYTGNATVAYTIGAKDIAEDFSYTYGGVLNKELTFVYEGRGYVPTLVVKDGDDVLTKGTDYTTTFGNNVNVSTEDAKATITIAGTKNYKGSKVVNFTITKKDITDNDKFVISDIAAVDYTGEAHNPALTIKYTNDKGNEIDVTDADYTVSAEGNTDAGTATLTITGQGNYTGTATKTFGINKINLTVNATDYTKSLGNADPTSDELASGKYYELTGFVNGEDADKASVTGAPTFDVDEHTETAGTKSNVISVASIGTLAAKNYNFVVGSAASLIISKAGVSIAVADATETYGYKLPTLDKDAFAFTATGLLAGESITDLTFTVKQGAATYNAGDRLGAGEYDIIASGAVATSGSYEFDYTEAVGTLTIDPYEIKIVAKAQALDYSNPTPVLDSEANTYIEIQDALGTTLGKNAFVEKYGVWKSDFVASMTWEAEAGYEYKPVAHPGFIVINLKSDYDNVNFVVKTEKGAVTYTGLVDVIAFDDSKDDNYSTIKTYNNVTKDVTVKISNRSQTIGSSTFAWNAKQYQLMVLPFNVEVSELSQQLGYAVVNRVDPGKALDNNVYWSLEWGTIPANEPFVVRTAEAIPAEGKTLSFSNKTIVAPATATPSVPGGNGFLVVGAYETYEINQSSASAHKFFGDGSLHGIKAGSSAKWDVIPFDAYVDLSASPAPDLVTFTFEDLNGGTTAIRPVEAARSSVSAEGWYNLNGVKLQGAPTEKGIYIQNGKKIVIK